MRRTDHIADPRVEFRNEDQEITIDMARKL